jgi:hypothetical protein
MEKKKNKKKLCNNSSDSSSDESSESHYKSHYSSHDSQSSHDESLKQKLTEYLLKYDKKIKKYIDGKTNIIQLQINDINKKYLEIKKILNNNNDQYINVIKELNNLYNITSENINMIKKCCDDKCDKNNLTNIYDDPTKVYTITYTNKNPKTILITAVGGGGAGGVGNIVGQYYYSGGGGGAGACIIQHPVKLIKDTIITINVGQGGCSKSGAIATDSYIEIKYPNGDKEIIIASHGECGKSTCDKIIKMNKMYNGSTNITMEILNEYIQPGSGGISKIQKILDGQDGMPGNISIPSFISLIGGAGGNSVLYVGGTGGSNLMSSGGLGGTKETLIGYDGSYGSGGGGSLPISFLSTHDTNEKYSGNGGNGIVIIS